MPRANWFNRKLTLSPGLLVTLNFDKCCEEDLALSELKEKSGRIIFHSNIWRCAICGTEAVMLLWNWSLISLWWNGLILSTMRSTKEVRNETCEPTYKYISQQQHVKKGMRWNHWMIHFLEYTILHKRQKSSIPLNSHASTYLTASDME